MVEPNRSHIDDRTGIEAAHFFAQGVLWDEQNRTDALLGLITDKVRPESRNVEGPPPRNAGAGQLGSKEPSVARRHP